MPHFVGGKRIDPDTGDAVEVDNLENLINRGLVFQSLSQINLGAGLARWMLIQVDAAARLTIASWSFWADGDAQGEMYTGSTPDAPVGGAPLALDTDYFNKNRNFGNDIASTIIDQPSLAGTWGPGTLCDIEPVDVANQAQFRSADIRAGQNKWVLAPSGNYAVRLLNNDGGNPTNVVLKMLFYELPA